MSDVFDFGPFRLNPGARILQENGHDLALGSRAFDILVALVEGCGKVLTRRELMAVAWSGLVVEDSNVRVQVANLRKILRCGHGNARYIASVAGRGYCFVAPVRRTRLDDPPASAAGVDAMAPALRSASRAKPRPHVPAPLARAFGRDDSVAELSQLVLDSRLVTVVGAGGAGKTTLAVLVAHTVEPFDDSIFFVDLSIVSREELVVEALASAVGYRPSGPVLVPGLVEVLSSRRTLIVLDNCEHLIDAVAVLCAQIVAQTTNVSFLNTSREALRVDDEHVYLLRPLASPPNTGRLTAEQALIWPAVQLFMERARDGGVLGSLGDDDAATVAAICRRLDGNPLAIGLVASRIAAYGIQGVSDLLANQLALHWLGRRDAIPRHKTVEAMIDWSHDLLPERDRQVLYRLSVFSGSFSTEAAIDVISDAVIGPMQAGEAIGDLVDKSLIAASLIDGETQIRLLETTRAYATAKLEEIHGKDELARRHALYYVEQLRRHATKGVVNRTGSMPPKPPDIGNVRVAMDWCFSSTQDLALGSEMSYLAAPLLLEQSLLNECKRCCERALTRLPENLRSSRVELGLLESLAITCYSIGDYDGAMTSVIERGLEISHALGDRRTTFHLLAGLHLALMANGRFPESLLVAERYAAMAAVQGGPCEAIIAGWMAGSSNHYSGRQKAADDNYASSSSLVAQNVLRPLSYFEMKEDVVASIGIARVKWMQGFPLQALEVARKVIDDSRRHPDSLYLAVTLCFPIILQNEQDGLAETLIQDLADVANEYKMGTRRQVAHFLKGNLLLYRGHVEEAAQQLRQCLEILPPPKMSVVRTDALQALAEALRRQGDGFGALLAINEAIDLAEETGGVFNLPDLLRTKAEVMAIVPGVEQKPIDDVLNAAMDCARRQCALGWEMSVALTMAEAEAAQGRRREAKRMLKEVYGRFTEGFDTSVLKATANALAGM
jgi:predicted ATPase/DNA-binding winged helix-turn-helix (wHTH) protein